MLRPGGRFVMMVYNRRSLRRALAAPAPGRSRAGATARAPTRRMRARYDASASGDAAPHTDFVTAASCGACCTASARCASTGATWIPLPLPLVADGAAAMPCCARGVDRLVGLDLYAVAER